MLTSWILSTSLDGNDIFVGFFDISLCLELSISHIKCRPTILVVSTSDLIGF